MIKTKLQKFGYNGFSLEKLRYLHTFDFDINFIIGGRANYKTSTLQQYAIDEFMRYGTKSIRLVRYADDGKAQFTQEFFSEYVKKYVYEKYDKAVLIYYRQAYYIAWYDDEDKLIEKRQFMRIVALSQAQKFKSNGLEKYDIIIFDEFAPEENVQFLRNEFSKMTSFLSTVNRNRTEGVRLYLIGNMISVDNLYFTEYGIDALELITNNIYDYSIDGYQRVGVYVVEPIHEDFTKAARILRTYKNNVQETSQNKYEIPEDIISVSDVFLYLYVNDYEKWKNRFYISYVIDATVLDDHICYLVIYQDKYNEVPLYLMTNKMDNSDVSVVFTDEWYEKNITHTTVNSVVDAPVFNVKGVHEMKYCDRNARQIFRYLKQEKLL